MSSEYPVLSMSGSGGGSLSTFTYTSDTTITVSPSTSVMLVTACGGGAGGGSGCGASNSGGLSFDGFGGGGGSGAVSTYQWPIFLSTLPPNNGQSIDLQLVIGSGGQGGTGGAFGAPQPNLLSSGNDGYDGTVTQIWYNGNVIFSVDGGMKGKAGYGGFHTAIDPIQKRISNSGGIITGHSKLISDKIIVGTAGENTNPNGDTVRINDISGGLFPTALSRTNEERDAGYTSQPYGGAGGHSLFGEGAERGVRDGSIQDAEFYGAGGGGSAGAAQTGGLVLNGGAGGSGVIILQF